MWNSALRAILCWALLRIYCETLLIQCYLDHFLLTLFSFFSFSVLNLCSLKVLWFFVLSDVWSMFFIEHFQHCYNQTSEIPVSCFNYGCILAVFWTIRKKQFYTWWVAWIFKASRFFFKSFKIVNLEKSFKQLSFNSERRSPKTSKLP